MIKIPSVNFHLLEQCNMSCKFCYAKNIGKSIPNDDACKIIKAIAKHGFEKINFAGGEPMLYPKLARCIQLAKQCKMTTSIVTNGSKITDAWLDEVKPYLDWIALSIDTDDPEINKQHGRISESGPISRERYLEMAQSIKQHGIRLKINTVVTSLNCNSDLSGFIRDIGPKRWKVLQALPIDEQNDGFQKFITREQFEQFVQRNDSVKQDGIAMVYEDNDLMKSSYIMINPLGCFFDNTDGSYKWSPPILDVGVEKALKKINIDPDKFRRRDGYYEW